MTCAVVGIGRTEYSRNSGRTTRGMAVAACRDAIADAGLTPSDVDGICTYMANDSEQPIYVGWALGIDELAWANAMYGGGNLVADQIATAAAVIEAGMCKAVLVYRSLNGRSGYRFGHIEGPMQVQHHDQFDTASGFHGAAAVVRDVGPSSSARIRLYQRGFGAHRDHSAQSCRDPTSMLCDANRLPWTTISRRAGSTSRSGYWTAHRRSTAR